MKTTIITFYVLKQITDKYHGGGYCIKKNKDFFKFDNESYFCDVK